MGNLKMEPVAYRAEDYEFDAAKLPGAMRVGPRTVLLAALACFAVFDPTSVTTYGPFIGAAIFITGRPGRLRIDLPNTAALALAAWALVSSQWSPMHDFSLHVGISYLAMAIVFIAARDTMRTVAQLRLVAIGYLIGCFILAGRVIMQARSGSLLPDDRLNLEGLNINYGGYAFAAGFAMLVLLWVTKPLTFRRRAGIILTAAALIVGIELADTRGAFVGLGFMAVWLLACAAFKRPPFRILVTVVLAAAWAIASGAVDSASLALEGMFGRATGDWSGRLIIWPLAREYWADHFWIGGGASMFMHHNVMGIGAHDLVLELGTGLGVVGVAIYAVVLWSALGKRTSAAGPRLAAVLVGSFVAVSTFSYLTGHWELSPAAWIGLAVFSRVGLLGKDPAMQWRTAEPQSNPEAVVRPDRTPSRTVLRNKSVRKSRPATPQLAASGRFRGQEAATADHSAVTVSDPPLATRSRYLVPSGERRISPLVRD